MSEVIRQVAGVDALEQAVPKTGSAPAREDMLAQVYLRASLTKEHRMNVIERLFAGKPLAVKAALAVALLLAIGALALVLPPSETSLAATESVVLSYDLSAYEREQALSKLHEIEAAINANLASGVELLTANLKAEVRREQRIMRDGRDESGATVGAAPQEIETRVITGVLVLSAVDEAALAELRGAIAKAVPGIGDPQVHDATWFRENGGKLDGGVDISLNLNGSEHVFNFPEGTGADEMERQIKEWAAREHPGEEIHVEVQLEEHGSGDKVEKRVEVRIQTPDHAR
jgi:hypothetical protein